VVDVVALGTGLLFTAIGIGLVIVGALTVRYGRREQRRSNRLAETETTEIDFLEPGTVEIKGTARPLEDGTTVEGPLSGDEALVTTVVRSLRMRWPKRQAGMSGRSTGLSTGWNTS